MPNMHTPKLNKQSLGLSTHVYYDKYNPNQDQSTHGRKLLVELDYSPLRRVTWASFNMGVLVSMVCQRLIAVTLFVGETAI